MTLERFKKNIYIAFVMYSITFTEKTQYIFLKKGEQEMINYNDVLDEFLNDEIQPRKAKILLCALVPKLSDEKKVKIDIFFYSKLLKKKPAKIVRYLLTLHAERYLNLITYDLETGSALIEHASEVKSGEES